MTHPEYIKRRDEILGDAHMGFKTDEELDQLFLDLVGEDEVSQWAKNISDLQPDVPARNQLRNQLRQVIKGNE